MSEPIAILSIIFGAFNALGSIWAIWTHCRRDIEHRARMDARLEALERQ